MMEVIIGLSTLKKPRPLMGLGEARGQCYKTFYGCNYKFRNKLERLSLASLSSLV
jgi:hypothetical protein